MEPYTGFAEVYDIFMDNIPYEAWADYLCRLLKKYGISDGLILEMGCGTGNLTEILASRGYDMIGIDNSEEMLQCAIEKRQKSGFDILYLLQDMREFELYGTVRAVVSICDSINYIMEYEDLVNVFRLVNNYLDPEGIFIFDLNTEYKYREVVGNQTIAESREDCSFIWENEYDEESKINEYQLTLFIKQEGELFRRYEEIHCQRAYAVEEVTEALVQAGMELMAVYHAFTTEAVQEDSERIYVIARERGKNDRQERKR